MSTLIIERGKGNVEALRKIEDADKFTRRGARRGWFSSGAILKNTVNRDILEKPKSGRVYRIRRGRRSRRHRASAGAPAGPFNIGESPANISGTLRRSYGYQVHGWEEMEFGSLAERDAPYSAYLEDGTRRMKRRPAIRNAFLKNRGNMQSILSKDVESEFKE